MTNNALAKLAERLSAHIVPIAGCVGSAQCGREIADDVRKAQRIVAELAKTNKAASAKFKVAGNMLEGDGE